MTRRIIACAVAAIALILALTGCSGGTKTAATGSTTYTPAQSARTTAPSVAADALDMAITEAGNYLGGRIPKGDKVAFVSAGQNLLAVAGYVIDGLIEKAVNDDAFAVVDRAQLDAIRLEQEFQLSGDVNDSTVQSIGRILGVRTIVTVVITQMGEAYRLGVRALSIESAQIQGQFNRTIPGGPTINALAGAPAPAKPVLTRPATATPAPQQTVAQSFQSQPSASATTSPAQQSAAISTAPAIPTGAVTPQGNTLAEQLAFIESQAGRGTVYDVVVKADEEAKPMTVSTMGKDITVVIRSADPKSVRTIELHENSKGHLLSVDANITLKLQDIVFKGHKRNGNALIAVGKGATLILNSGVKIYENRNGTFYGGGGGILVSGGVFELNDGAEIIGNHVIGANGCGGGIYAEKRSIINIRGGIISENRGGPYSKGGGICIADNSTLVITGGTISKNTASMGGGIHIMGTSTTTMSGGVISGNLASDAHGIRGDGGGVYINNSSFVKKPAIRSDNSGVIYGSTGQNANTARGGRGHAVYRYNVGASETKSRNTTLGVYDEISTESSKGWE